MRRIVSGHQTEVGTPLPRIYSYGHIGRAGYSSRHVENVVPTDEAKRTVKALLTFKTASECNFKKNKLFFSDAPRPMERGQRAFGPIAPIVSAPSLSHSHILHGRRASFSLDMR